MKSFLILITVALLFTGCSSSSVTTQPVQDFDLNRYLGQWYEIARIDFKYEKNMDNTTANYSKNSNGTVKVVNRGYDFVKKVWKEAEGKAKFRGESTVGALKVSFFGPFYSDYNILALDDYKYALVAGKTVSFYSLTYTVGKPAPFILRFVEDIIEIYRNILESCFCGVFAF